MVSPSAKRCAVEATSACTSAARYESSTSANWEASASRRSSASSRREIEPPTLLIDHRLGGSRESRVSGEPGPGAAARALQVDRGDLAIRRGRTGRSSSGSQSLAQRGWVQGAAAAPKRSFRLPRPVFSNVETAVRTTTSG